MCNYKVYHQSEYGYLVRCRCCGHFQLAFGTIAVSLTADQFSEMTVTVNEYHLAYGNDAFRDQKTIRIPAASKAVSIALTVNELDILHNILDESLILLQTDELLAS